MVLQILLLAPSIYGPSKDCLWKKQELYSKLFPRKSWAPGPGEMMGSLKFFFDVLHLRCFWKP